MLLKNRKTSMYAKYNKEEFGVEEIDAIEPNGIEDQIIAENDEAELVATMDEIDEVQNDMETNDAVGEEVVEQMEANEELIEAAEAGEAEVTPDDVAVSNECYVSAVSILNLDMPSIANNHESLTRDPLGALKTNNEGLADVWSKIKETAKKAWEYIVKLFNKVVDFLKKLLPTRKNKLTKLKKALEAIGSGKIHTDVEDEWETRAENQYKAFMYGVTEGLKTLSEITSNAADNIDAVADEIEEVSKAVDEASKELENGKPAEEVKDKLNKDKKDATDKKEQKTKDKTAVPTKAKSLVEKEVEKDLNDIIGENYEKPTITNMPLGYFDKDQIVIAVEVTATGKAGTDVEGAKATFISNEYRIDVPGEAHIKLDYSKAKKEVEDYLKDLNSVQRAIDKAKKAVDKATKNTQKELKNLEKVSEADGATKESKAITEAYRTTMRSAQKSATYAVKTLSNADKVAYAFTVEYAARTIKGIKKQKAEDAADKK